MTYMKASIKMGSLKDLEGTFGHVACSILVFGKTEKEMVMAPNSKKMELLKSKVFGRTIN